MGPLSCDHSLAVVGCVVETPIWVNEVSENYVLVVTTLLLSLNKSNIFHNLPSI